MKESETTNKIFKPKPLPIKHFRFQNETFSTSNEHIISFATEKLDAEILNDLPNDSYVGTIANTDSFKKRFGVLYISHLAEKNDPKSFKKLSQGVLGGYNIQNYILNIELFHEENRFFYDDSGLFWFWNKELNCYKIVDDIDLMNELDDVLQFNGQTVNKTLKSHYMEAFKRVGRKKKPLDAPSKWIQFKDKAFSITSNEIYDVKPNYFFTNPIPWDIGETEETPIMDQLIKDWVGEDYVKSIYEIIAYCCYADYPIHRIFCFMGSGRNGKSQLQRLMRTFIGEENCSDADLDDLMENRFAAWSLYKKLMCSMGETNFGTMRKTQKIKKLSGQDPVTFEKKNLQSFDGYNYAKLIVNTNSLPSTADTSDGFFRRWMIIQFRNEFKEGKDVYKSIPDIEYNNLALKVCRILPELLKKGSFTNEGTITERRKLFEMNSNPLPYFISTFCIKSNDTYLEKGKLYTEYCRFLAVQKQRKVSNREFIESLNDLGFFPARTTKKIKSDDFTQETIYKTANWIEGLSLKNSLVYRRLTQYDLKIESEIEDAFSMEPIIKSK